MSVYVPKTMIGRAGLAAWRQVGREETSLVDAVQILGSIRTPDMDLCLRVGRHLRIEPATVDLCWVAMISAILAEQDAEEKAQAEFKP